MSMRTRIRELFFEICISNEVDSNVARHEFAILTDFQETIKAYTEGHTDRL
jgi:hypothetical protein